MGKVIFDISMSLDGFITGANPRSEAGWGGLGEESLSRRSNSIGRNEKPFITLHSSTYRTYLL
jgi:hypothetical protein